MIFIIRQINTSKYLTLHFPQYLEKSRTQANYRWAVAYDLKVVQSDAPREESGFGDQWQFHDLSPQRAVQLTEADILSSPMLRECNNPSGRLFEGDFVVRGTSWVHGDADGGDGRVGVVKEDATDGFVTVTWMANNSVGRYSYGNEGSFEVSLVLFACLERQKRPFKHWCDRILKIPHGDALTCKYCSTSLSAASVSDTLPFFCEECNFTVCNSCYHKRPPPPKSVLKSRFSLSSCERYFSTFFPGVSTEEMYGFLSAADGDHTGALLAYNQHIPDMPKKSVSSSTQRPQIPMNYLDLKHSLFQISAQEGNLEIVKALVSSGFDANSSGQRGRTALHTASLNGQLHVVEYLIKEALADANVPDEQGDGALAHCSQGGYVVIGEILLKNGARVNNPSNNSLTPLMRAVLNKRSTMVELLLDWNATVDTQDVNRNTACHFAVIHNTPECLEKLVKKGANPNIQNGNNFTPLHECGKELADRCADILVQNGADLTIRDEEGRTAIHTAAAFNAVGVIEHILNKDSACINTPDYGGNTPLHVACKIVQTSADRSQHVDSRDEEAAEILINRGAKISDKDGNFMEPIHIAAASGMERTCKLLVGKGVDVNSKVSSNGYTALHIASHRRRAEVVKTLLAAGANVNVEDANGETPLYQACNVDDFQVARVLVEHKADANIRSRNTGKSPLHLGFSIYYDILYTYEAIM